jgi:BirA family biotin operon repressor/biotin-[acetyl-CoA-carboxylase] ligase
VRRLGQPRLHLRETDSTNDLARALAAAGAPHGTLVTAGAQAAGRGRQGRVWIGPPGRALLLSLLVRELDPLLSLRAGLAVADVAGPDARVKWPNDVLLDGRKVAGILVEGRPQENWAVIGIGVNVGTQRVVDADYGTAALAELWPEATPQAALARIAAPLVHALAAFDRDGFGPLQDAYARRDVLRGRLVKTTDPALPEGVAAGVDVDGALKLTAGGRTHRVLSGEISVRLA